MVAIPLRGFLFATATVRAYRQWVEEVSCNPLTGLFVCDQTLPHRAQRGHRRLQSPYGAFCLRHMRKDLQAFMWSCNPLTGLFVCDLLLGPLHPVQRVRVAIPLRGFLFATPLNLLVHLLGEGDVAIPLRGFLFATRG